MEDTNGGVEIYKLYIIFRHSPEQLQIHRKNNVINNNPLED